MAALSIGARGPQVASLQKRLHELGYARVLPDGVFGPATQAAVGDLQHRHGLDATGKVSARLAALIASPDVLSPPRRPIEDIEPDEVKGQMPFVTAALGAADHATRRIAAAEGFMTFGPRFMFLLGQALQWARDAKADPATEAKTTAGIAQTEEAIADLEHVDAWFLDWLRGERFTENLEEPERRADVAAMVLDELGWAGLTRVAVDAILALPDGHKKRNVERARTALLAHLNRCRILRDHSTALATIRDLVSNQLVLPAETERLIREGARLLERIDDVSERRNFWVTVFGHHLGRAFDERDRLDARSSRFKIDGEDEKPPPSRRRMVRSRAQAEQAFAKMEALLGELPEADRARVSAKNRYALAALYGLDQPAKSVEMLHSVIDSQALDEDTLHGAARLEAKQRLLLGQWDRACELLEPRIEFFERRYLAAVDAADIDEAGEEYFEVLQTVAWANVAGNRWDRVVQVLARGRGIRLRYRAALRGTPDGERVLALERRLHALDRGVPVEPDRATRERSRDWIGVSLSARTAALEQYRRARQKAAIALAHPDARALGAALRAGEAVAILDLSYRGLLIAVVCAGDIEPSGFTFEKWTKSRVTNLLVGRELDGWLMALGGRIDPIDLRAPLEQVLREMNRAVGIPLGNFARDRGIAHLTIVPDPWLDFVPLWALRGLSRIDVAIASSLAQFTQRRDDAPLVARSALLVGDPTEDLPAAIAESSAVAARMQSKGVQVERLDRAQATVGAASGAARTSDLLHFAGHGRSVLSEPLRSALELHPDWARAPVASAQALAALFKRDDIAWEQIYDEIREATVAGVGRLRELRRDEQSPVDRWLDYAEDRTLWTSGEDAEIVADLWTAGAMTIATPFASTRLAFLSACSSGGASTPSNEGASGLVAALQLAGVATVISTRWEIDDAVALLFADLFYEGLARAEGTATVTRVLRQAAVGMRKMPRDRAARRTEAILAHCDDEQARNALQGFLQDLRALDATPFAHPYYWASYHVSGNGSLRVVLNRSEPTT